MAWMHRRRLLQRIEIERVRKAIEEAEKQTSGEIVVSIARFFWGRVKPAAERAFKRLGMARTRQRNGILFFIVPGRRLFFVLGGKGIHEKVGQEFWDGIAAAMSEDFKKGDFTDGLVRGIETAASGLTAYFPFDPSADVNELPDDVDFGSKPNSGT